MSLMTSMVLLMGTPSPGYFLAQSVVMKRLRSGLRYVVGHTWSGPKPFCGLNAKARRVAGLNLYSIS